APAQARRQPRPTAKRRTATRPHLEKTTRSRRTSRRQGCTSAALLRRLCPRISDYETQKNRAAGSLRRSDSFVGFFTRQPLEQHEPASASACSPELAPQAGRRR